MAFPTCMLAATISGDRLFGNIVYNRISRPDIPDHIWPRLHIRFFLIISTFVLARRGHIVSILYYHGNDAVF